MPVLLVPAFQPDEKLLELLRMLKEMKYPIIVINDGSSKECAQYFDAAERMGIQVLHHAVNLGKGRALKTGFNEVMLSFPDAYGVVTADADGQHSPKDIVRVAEELIKNEQSFVIGARNFAQMPGRSKAGNRFMRFIFCKLSGLNISDTQTGLRGIPMQYLPDLMQVKGERYEFEMNMLLQIREMNAAYMEIPIDTIYFEGNKKSHFRTIQDALRVFGSLFRYTFSAFLSFLVDYGLYMLLLFIGLIKPEFAAVLARLASAAVNYLCNRYFVFRCKDAGGISGLYYAILAGFGMLVLFFAVKAFDALGMPALLSKIVIDIVLFFFNYFIQRKFIFVSRKNKKTKIV